jgi:hypothetical protein
MNKKGYIKTVEAIIAAGMIFIFSTILITNPMGIVRKVDMSDLKATSSDALRVTDKAMHDGTRTDMEYYLAESQFPPAAGDPMFKGLYDLIGQGLPSNVRYQLRIEGSNNLGQGGTVSIGPEPNAPNVITTSYLKSMAGFLSASQFPPIGVLAAVDDQYDIDFLCATVGRAQELYPDIQINFTMVNLGSASLLGCDLATPLPPQSWNDYESKMTGQDYFVYLFEDIQAAHLVPGTTWNKYLSEIQCIGNSGVRRKGIIFGADTLYHIWKDGGQGWQNFVSTRILGVNKAKRGASDGCNKITDTWMKLVPSDPRGIPPDTDNRSFTRNIKIAQYHFITRDFIKGDILRYNDLWNNEDGIPIFHPATRPTYWPCVNTGEAITGCSTTCGNDDDFYCQGPFSLYISYDISMDTTQTDREKWYELVTNSDIEGTWNPDTLLPQSPTPCTGYNFNENRAAILKQVMPEDAQNCSGTGNLCGRYAINLIRLGRAWEIYNLYYQNWGQIKEPEEGGNGTIDETPVVDDQWDTGLSCYPSSCVIGSIVDPGAIIIQPGPNGILDTVPAPSGDDQIVRDMDALAAAEDLTTLMFEEIVWASFWDTPFEYRIYKLVLITWYSGGEFEMMADSRRWSYA